MDLNTASQAELEALQGIGPVLAKRIIEGRPYARVDDLDMVKGIGPKTMAELRPLVRAVRGAMSGTDPNDTTGSAEALARLHTAGWSAGDTAFLAGEGLVWVVVLTKEGRTLRAEAPTQAEAWGEAVRLAELGPVANGRP